MSEERYTLEQDDDGHWYIVPCRVIREFENWLSKCGEEEFDPYGFPEGVEKVGGAYNLVTFTNPVVR